MMSRTHDWKLEKLRLGELSETERSRLAASLGEEELKRRLLELERSDERILTLYPSERIAGRIREKAATRRGGAGLAFLSAEWLRELGWQKAFATAALVLIVPAVTILSQRRAELGVGSTSPALTAGTSSLSSASSEDRTKGAGGAFLRIYRKSPDGFEQLTPGARAKEHDLIQLSYVSTGKYFGAVFSVDSRNNVTVHYPDKSARSAGLAASREVFLPSSFELDDSPGFERFYFVTSDKPFEVQSAIKAALGSERPAELQFYSIALQK